MRQRYFRALHLIAWLVTAGAAYGLGLRGDTLFFAVVLALWPVSWLIAMLNLRLFPPEVELSGDFRGVLHFDGRKDPLRPPDPVVLGVPRHHDFEIVAPVEDGSGIFKQSSEPRSLEGVVIHVAGAALVAFAVYMAFEPLIYRVFPEYRATREGPRGFPVTIHIGPAALRIDNRSSEPWNCSIELGGLRRYSGSIVVGAHASNEIHYQDFRASDRGSNTDPDSLRRAARQEVELECQEPSGLSHYSALQ